MCCALGSYRVSAAAVPVPTTALPCLPPADNIGTLPFVSVLIAMCPWTLLGKGCVDLGEATADQNSNGIQWADRFS